MADSDGFVLQGKQPPIREQPAEDYLTNSQKTISSLNLSLNMKQNKSPSIADLQQSVDNLKLEMRDLHRSMSGKYGNSLIYHDNEYNSGEKVGKTKDEENPDLKFILQREDAEAVCKPPPDDKGEWFREPQHLTEDANRFPTMKSIGIVERSTRPVTRASGVIGSEVATKDGIVVDLAAGSEYFPVRLTAPHIVGVKSLLPPKYAVRAQNPDRTKPLQKRSKSVEPKILIGGMNTIKSTSPAPTRRSDSPKPVWMPTTPKPQHVHTPMPKFTQSRGRSGRRTKVGSSDFSKSLTVTTKTYQPVKYQRPMINSAGESELRFLKSADELDTRAGLVENSPYQQALSKLRLERIRVEEEYLLQLKRESELERIRGPKPKWYEQKGPEFHYECGKNTSLHKSKADWSDTLEYRRQLMTSSRQFAANLRGPVAT